MLEKLGNAIKSTTDKIANAMFVDKKLVNSITKDLQRALISADVDIKLVKQITDKIKKEALSEKAKKIDKKEQLIKLLHDELINILGEKKEIEIKQGKQERIMLVGLYGSGKTTTIAKLGNYYSKRGKKVALVGLDVHRPAAKDQLEQLGKENNLHVFVDKEKNDAEKTWKELEKKGKLKDYDLVLIDTAGRHSLDEDLVKEIKSLNRKVKPDENLLVMSADIGQSAKKQAEEFKKSADITGVIITKMDSTAKAGGALTACNEAGAGVSFITTGEKINDIETFDPESFLSRLLGMGDLESLMEKIKSATGEDKQQEMQEKLKEGKLNLEDVIEQIKSMNSMGGFGKLKNMVPGMSKAKLPEDKLEKQEEKVQKWEHIIKSMTKKEKENPFIFDDEEEGTSRINRVARGSGVNNSDVRALLKQYKMLQEMMKDSAGLENIGEGGMSQKQMQKLMKKFGKKGMKL